MCTVGAVVAFYSAHTSVIMLKGKGSLFDGKCRVCWKIKKYIFKCNIIHKHLVNTLSYCNDFIELYFLTTFILPMPYPFVRSDILWAKFLGITLSIR